MSAFYSAYKALYTGPVPHGTAGGYKNYRCRCDACTEANGAAHYDYMHRSGRTRQTREEYLESVRTPIVHGKESSYGRRGCRCDLCREAATEGRRRRRLRVTP